jgi:hypothetical protein
MLALTPALDAPCTRYANAALTGETLSDRERALAVLTTVLVLEDHDLIEQAWVCAKQVGITNEAIGQTSAIVLAVQGVFKRYGLQCSPASQRGRTDMVREPGPESLLRRKVCQRSAHNRSLPREGRSNR